MHRLTSSHSALRAGKPRRIDPLVLAQQRRQKSASAAVAEGGSRSQQYTESREEYPREPREGQSRQPREWHPRQSGEGYSQSTRQRSRPPREFSNSHQSTSYQRSHPSLFPESSRSNELGPAQYSRSNAYGKSPLPYKEDRRPRSRDGPRPPRLVQNEERHMIIQSTQDVVSKSLKTHKSTWKQTPSLRGEEMRLKSSIKLSATTTRAPSLQKQAYLAGPVAEEDESVHVNMDPGTFVETRRNQISSHGMVLCRVYDDSRWKIRTLMNTGEIWEPLPDDVVFSIPSFAPADLAQRCGEGVVPSTDGELSARVEALRCIREIEKSVEDTYRKFSHRDLDVYSMVKDPNDEAWGTTTVAEIAHLFEPNMKVINLFAVHQYLVNDPVHFLMDTAYQINQQFRVRPKAEVDLYMKVQAWARIKTNGPIQRFAAKVREVIALQKQVHAESALELPSQTQANHTWNAEDRDIINFLIDGLRPTRSTQEDPYSVPQSAIVYAINPTEPEVKDEQIHTLLMDLGVLAPWQDLVVLRPELNLDLHPEHVSPLVKSTNELVLRSTIPRPPDQPMGPEDFHLTDPLESVRHDFGDMPVYVIDDAGSEELDDGISVERIPSEPGNLWTHIHIADPASVIPPSHVLAQSARRQGQTAYFLHRSFPLFPKLLMHHPQYGLSLGSKKEARLPDRVLTFSVKTDPQGQILDLNVRAGLIRNVHVLSYDAVDLAVDGGVIERKYPFGGLERPVPEPVHFTEAHLRDLRDLREAAQRQVRKRMRDDLYAPSSYGGQVSKVQIDPSIESPTIKPAQFRGFPSAIYAVVSDSSLDSRSRNTVAEMMKLACRAASIWSNNLRLPMLRRVAPPWIHISDAGFEKILSMRDSTGHVGFVDAIPYVAQITGGEYSIEPKSHWTLGVPEGEGYTRVTSPLRRFSDLIAHWQIHHALLGANAPTSSPPFDNAFLQDYGIMLKSQDSLWKRAEDVSNRFWMLRYIQRVIQGNIQTGAELLHNIEARGSSESKMDTHSATYHMNVVLPELGMKGVASGVAKNEPLSVPFRVRVKNIKLGTRPQLEVVKC